VTLREAQEGAVGGEHRELVADAQLGEERIDVPIWRPRLRQALRSPAASM
jgi:hypothetical protein